MRSLPLRALFGVALLATLPLSGCFGADPAAPERALSATGGKVSAGWAYDGVGLEAGSASLEGLFNNPDNTGLATATFQFGGSTYVVTFDQFAASAEFQDGGIAFDLVEHGDSGVADASIPKITALVAAWGTANVTKDGEPLVGQAGDRWSAHLMAAAQAVRGADGKIAKADGKTPYDPDAPADARTLEGQPQAILWIKSPDGPEARRAPLTGSTTMAFQGSGTTKEETVPVEKGAVSGLVNWSVSPLMGPAQAGEVRVDVLDGEGKVLFSTGAVQVTPANAPAGSIPLVKEMLAGPLTLQVTGTGAFGVTLDHQVTYDDQPFLVVTWDQYTLA